MVRLSFFLANADITEIGYNVPHRGNLPSSDTGMASF